MKPISPALRADSLPLSHWGIHFFYIHMSLKLVWFSHGTRSHITLILRPLEEPERTEENFFLPNTYILSTWAGWWAPLLTISPDITVFGSCECYLGDSHCDFGEKDPGVLGHRRADIASHLLLPDPTNQRKEWTNWPWWTLNFSFSPPFQKILWEPSLPHTAGVLPVFVLYSQVLPSKKTVLQPCLWDVSYIPWLSEAWFLSG